MSGGRAAKLRAWLLVTAALVAVAGGQSHEGEHEGHPGPFGQHGHQEGEPEGFHRPAAVCTSEQTKDAVEASSTYVECAGLKYADFMSLVHADMEVLGEAAACFKGKVEELKPEVAPGEKADKTEEEVKEMNDKLDKAFDACVDEAKAADETGATQATTDFLQKMLGPDSKVCTCFPAFVDKMPECESWSRFHHFGLRLEELCNHIDGAPMFPGPVEAKEEEEVTPAEEKSEIGLPQGEAGADMEVKAAAEPEAPSAGTEGEGEPHLPDAWGPCPPGHEVHPDDPKDCQPVTASEEGFGGPADGRGPPSGGGGGIFGLGMSVLGVVAVGGVVGFGGVWAWGKFSSSTRQPGVRYMATGFEDDNLGTELGPFGREYA